jgi:hypothetical protein
VIGDGAPTNIWSGYCSEMLTGTFPPPASTYPTDPNKPDKPIVYLYDINGIVTTTVASLGSLW